MLKFNYLVSTLLLAILSVISSSFKSDSASLKVLINVSGESGYLTCDNNSKTTNKYRIDLEYQSANSLSSRDSLGCNKSNGNVGSTKIKHNKTYVFDNQELLLEDLSPGIYKMRLSVGENLGCLRNNGERSIVYRIQEDKYIQIFDETQTEVSFNQRLENNTNCNLSIFPNPSNSFAIASISVQNNIKGSLYMSDMNGRIIKSIDSNINHSGSDYYVKFDTESFPSGVYIVILKLEDGSIQSKKLVKL